MSIPTTRKNGDISRVDYAVDLSRNDDICAAWARVKSDIATRELAIAERDKAREAFRELEVEYDAALARAEACCEATELATVKLEQATKAGTAYWHERDTMNALVLENRRLLARAEAIEQAPPPDCGVLAARIVDGVRSSPLIDGHNPTEDQWRVIYRYRELVGQGVDFTAAATRARVEFVERVLAEAGAGVARPAGGDGGDGQAMES